MEAARLALQKACKELQMEDKKSSTSTRLGFARKSARVEANEAVSNSFVHDFKGLQAVVEGFESKWKDSQSEVSTLATSMSHADGSGKIGLRFRKVCQKLDDHKAAFAIFPSQDMYTSALCGSLAVIVGAAVNHNDIAERLSEMVVNISEKATRAASMVMIYRTKNFRELFSDLYAQVFLFYRDAIQWYAKSKVAKALDSFNENLVKRYERAAAKIEDMVVEIYREADVAKSAQMAVFVEDIEDRLRNQRAQYTDQEDLEFAGRQGQRLMLLMHESAYLESALPCNSGEQRIQTADDEPPLSSIDAMLGRADARVLSKHLDDFVVGTQGPSLFKDGRLWLPDTDVSFKLRDWIGPDTQLSTIWITSPAASRGFPGSRAAALMAAVVAWESNMPVISHFCARPSPVGLSRDLTVEKVGMIGLVYSLITQLLQFNVHRDSFRFCKHEMGNLDGSNQSWSLALLLLQELLRATPQLQRCIIDGLNDLCYSSGAKWCDDFLTMLFEHQKTFAPRFKILLTTTGQSRVLPNHVSANHTVFVQRGAREVVRGGKWLIAANNQ